MSVDPSAVAPLGAAEANPHPLPQPAEASEVMHGTRSVDFFQRRTPIVCQEHNDPCPLFAICNVLLLRGVITLDPDAGEVSQEKLLSLVAECLTDIKQDMDEGYARNREQNAVDAINVLPRLLTGIDMNMMFRKIDDFEFTPECAIFDLLGIPLYHGWVVDPLDTKTATAIGSKSYNALACELAEFKSVKPAEENKHVKEEAVDFAATTTAALKIPSPSVSHGRSFDKHTLSNSAVPEPHKRRGDLEEKDELTRVLKLSKVESGDAVDGEVTFDISHCHSPSAKLTPQSEGEAVLLLSEQVDKTEEKSPSVDDNATEWELIENFLQTNATQLTVHGLGCLHKDLKESELCVFFRNNHFNTMFKYKGRLYLLANDQGFINHTDLVWQRLDEVNGGGVFITSNFTLFKSETPRNDSWKKQQAMTSIGSLAQSDNASGEIPSDPTNDKMTDMLNEQCLSRAHGSKLLIFDALVANDFIVKKEWEDLDDYLGKFVATVLKKTPDEVVMMHPGLFMIPRMERLLDMLSDQNFGEAYSFYQSSIELLRGCQGRFVDFDLMRTIDELKAGVKTRSMPATRCSAERIGTRISDYVHLYFPSAILRDDRPIEGVWQFAMRLLKPDKQERVYYGFRCLLCGWVTKGSYCLRSHLSKDIRSCPKVTEDVLDRLRATGELKDLPTLEYIKDKFRKKRKSALSNIWVSRTVTSSTGSNTIGAGESKRLRSDDSLFLDTATSQMKPQLPVSPESTLPDEVTVLLTIVGELSKETAAILGRVTPFVVPSAEDRLFITNGIAALQHVLIQLRKCARVHANHPAPEELWRIVCLLDKTTKHVIRRIEASVESVVPDAEDRLFLLRRAVVVMELVLKIPIP